MATQGAQVVVFEGVWGAPLQDLSERTSVLCHDGTQLPAQADWLTTARAVVVRNKTQVTEEFLAAMPSLRVVARAGVGLDNIDVTAAAARDIAVVSPRGANATSVAEHTLGLALAVARSVVPLDRTTRAGGWTRPAGTQLSGRTWGLLGAGATGRATGMLAHGLSMQVLAYDPHVTPEQLDGTGIEQTDLHTVAARSAVLSCHLPATSETNGLVDADLLARLPAGAIFVNTGRGEVVAEDDLVTALESGHLAGAGLDVRSSEPPTRGRLEELDNVILTPHIAGITQESQHAILAALAADIDSVLAGSRPVNDVRPVAVR